MRLRRLAMMASWERWSCALDSCRARCSQGEQREGAKAHLLLDATHDEEATWRMAADLGVEVDERSLALGVYPRRLIVEDDAAGQESGEGGLGGVFDGLYDVADLVDGGVGDLDDRVGDRVGGICNGGDPVRGRGRDDGRPSCRVQGDAGAGEDDGGRCADSEDDVPPPAFPRRWPRRRVE